MELQFHGANCITLTTKNTRLTIDDNLTELGVKSVAKSDDIALFTSAHGDPTQPARLVIDLPGEYEVSGVSIYGIPARAHIDEANKKNATMYKIVAEDLKILVTGHVYPELTESQLEAIGMVDVMLVPVGGNGYTLDGLGALTLIKKVEPKLVIPTHYADKDLNFPVPQASLEDALQTIAMEVKETIPKLKLKSLELTDSSQLVVLERS
jgi:L-ascorbate metabolism protein UlaG (beta-lactamase superfamily)